MISDTHIDVLHAKIMELEDVIKKLKNTNEIYQKHNQTRNKYGPVHDWFVYTFYQYDLAGLCKIVVLDNGEKINGAPYLEYVSVVNNVLPELRLLWLNKNLTISNMIPIMKNGFNYYFKHDNNKFPDELCEQMCIHIKMYLENLSMEDASWLKIIILSH